MHAHQTKRCLLQIASSQLSAESCSAAPLSSVLNRTMLHTSCDRWFCHKTGCSQPPHPSCGDPNTSDAHNPSRRIALPESLPQRYRHAEGACCNRDIEPAAATLCHRRGATVGPPTQWKSAVWGAAASGRGFAAEGSQSPAEKFDLIRQEAGAVRIEGYTDTGFLVNDVTVDGALLCLLKLWVRWSPTCVAEVTPDSLAMLLLLRPLPEMLVLGTGARIELPSPAVRALLEERGIGLEVADTVNALATFNILSQEGRHVMAALLPLRPRSDSDQGP